MIEKKKRGSEVTLPCPFGTNFGWGHTPSVWHHPLYLKWGNTPFVWRPTPFGGFPPPPGFLFSPQSIMHPQVGRVLLPFCPRSVPQKEGSRKLPISPKRLFPPPESGFSPGKPPKRGLTPVWPPFQPRSELR